MPTIKKLPAPTYEAIHFLAHESECQTSLKPALAELLEMAVGAGWDRRIAATTLMFLAAQHVSTNNEASRSIF